MVIDEMTEKECVALATCSSLARLACALDNQPYIIPIQFAYEAGYIYAIATYGQKIEWMRENPKVCVAIDEIENDSQWASVIVNGEYEELREPRHTEERKHARELLERHNRWWQVAFAERQAKEGDHLIDPIFFRVKVESISGLQARDEG
jgi:nitroimidazol reductase NimA-like FMN-containing flavoprotein (pyridoxamine 5'-phosphate oxidase superfamily)